MENKNKGLITLLLVIIVILSVLCVLFATGTINFNANKELTNDKELINASKDAEWVDYLKKQDIVIKTPVWNTEKDECEYKEVSISTENVDKMLDEMSKKQITKYYYGDTPPTGTICSDRVSFVYEEHTVNMDPDGYVWINDDELYTKIALDVDNIFSVDNVYEGIYIYKFEGGLTDIFKSYNIIKEENINNNSNQNIVDNNAAKIDIEILNIDSPSIIEDSPSHNLRVPGSMRLSFDQNKFISVSLTGFCIGSNGEKYIMTGPGSGAIGYNSGDVTFNLVNSINNRTGDVIYTDGTTKKSSEIDWNNVEIKSCTIEKVIGVTQNETIENEINFTKEFTK